MQERHHIKTTPGEADAVPEYTPHPVRREEGGNVQMDDINIPLVAVIVAAFVAVLSVTIVGLQAGFYNYQAAERQRKMLAQDDPRMELGSLLQKQRNELYAPAGVARSAAPVATAPGTLTGATKASQPAPKLRIPIDQAMQIVMHEYQAGGGAK